MRRVARFVGLMRRSRSDVFDPFWLRLLGPVAWLRGLPGALALLWKEAA